MSACLMQGCDGRSCADCRLALYGDGIETFFTPSLVDKHVQCYLSAQSILKALKKIGGNGNYLYTTSFDATKLVVFCPRGKSIKILDVMLI